MLNMLKLDWLGMKYYWIRIIILPVATCLMGLLSEALIIPMIGFLMCSFSVNPFAMEEKGKLDNLYLTLPVMRRTIVNARLLLSVIMQLAGMITALVATLVLSKFLNGRTIFYTHNFQADFNTMLLIVCSSLLFYTFMNLAMFPILFKIGYAKGKSLGFYIPVAVVFVIVYGVYILYIVNDSFQRWLPVAIEWAIANTVLVSVIILVVAALVFAVSYALSHKVYAKREF